MPAQVSFPASSVTVEPGTEATCQVRVRNIGHAPGRFTLEVLGTAVSWTTLDPPVVDLGMDETAMVAVRLHPPRLPHVRAGAAPFGLLVTSESDQSSAVAEEMLVVAAYAQLVASLSPAARSGRSGRFTLAVRNEGNSPRQLSVDGHDDAGRLDVACVPSSLTVPPGEDHVVDVRVHLRRGAGAGGLASLPFEVMLRCTDELGEEPRVFTGTLFRRPAHGLR